MKMTSRALLVVAALIGLSGSSRAQQADPFPPGPGHDLVAGACSKCHAARAITQLRMNEDGWRRQVGNMVLRGAQVGPGDMDQVVAYLATTYGPGVPFPDQPPATAVHLAPGPGSELVEGGCGLCHGLDRVVAARRQPGNWPAIVHRMIEIGAPLDDAQARAVVSYLSTNYADPAH